MAISLGSVIGDYEVIGKLGAGGLGQVYQVRHTISQRLEAMKVLHADRMTSPETSDRFLREIRVLASLNHPHIAAFHTAFRRDGELVMIMEFVEGVTLRNKLRDSVLTIGQSVEYIRQVLSGLIYAHARGVIHRDIKPSNIMIDPAEQVKLLDFGLAMDEHASERTRSGLIMGSPHYMSPEQVTGDCVDARSDLYSVGVTLYQLLTGRPPIEGSSDYAIATGHLRDVPRPPSELNEALPSSLSIAVLRSLEKAPADRFQSAQHFLTALSEAVESLQEEETKSLISKPPTSNDRPSRGEPTPTPTPRTGTTLSGSGILPDVSRELAAFIGPVARVLVNRAAMRACTLEELYSIVSKEITSEVDRSRFLATRQKVAASHQQSKAT
jgi:eukaryotic-like serine/threonine-protein kinase